MSEEKKARTIGEIQGEYQTLCTKAGHIQYQISTLNKDLDLLNTSMRDLNFEAAKVSREAEEAKKEQVSE